MPETVLEKRISEVDMTAAVGTRPPLRHFSKIAIVGYTPHKMQAPFAGPGSDAWAIWGLNDLYIDIPDLEPKRLRWYQLHQWNEVCTWQKVAVTNQVLNLNTGPVHPRDPNHITWLANAAKNIPLYLREPREEIPEAYVLPKDQLYRFFQQPNCPGVERYFTNSISFMIGLAIMELVDPVTRRALPDAELGVWGVDMMVSGGQGSEYGYQRPSCEWLLGYAMAAGIKVHIPKESDLLKTAFPYGDEQGGLFRVRLNTHRNDLVQRLNALQAQANEANTGIVEIRGAINILDWVSKSLLPGDDGIAGTAPIPNAHKLPVDIVDRIDQLMGAVAHGSDHKQE